MRNDPSKPGWQHSGERHYLNENVGRIRLRFEAEQLLAHHFLATMRAVEDGLVYHEPR
jgi:hypothetical protein